MLSVCFKYNGMMIMDTGHGLMQCTSPGWAPKSTQKWN